MLYMFSVKKTEQIVLLSLAKRWIETIFPTSAKWFFMLYCQPDKQRRSAMHYAMLVQYVLEYTGKDIKTVRGYIDTYMRTGVLDPSLEDLRSLFEYVQQETATLQ